MYKYENASCPPLLNPLPRETLINIWYVSSQAFSRDKQTSSAECGFLLLALNLVDVDCTVYIVLGLHFSHNSILRTFSHSNSHTHTHTQTSFEESLFASPPFPDKWSH